MNAKLKPDPYSVPCPACGAKREEPCTNTRPMWRLELGVHVDYGPGKRTVAPHPKRHYEAGRV